MRHRLPQFSHLFASDAYSAGYYSYLWSDVMAADAWKAFAEAGGPWDKDVARRMREFILADGNAIDRAEAYRRFRGRDPDVKALLEDRGFPTPLAKGKGQRAKGESQKAGRRNWRQPFWRSSAFCPLPSALCPAIESPHAGPILELPSGMKLIRIAIVAAAV